jgi:hypothetical protein
MGAPVTLGAEPGDAGAAGPDGIVADGLEPEDGAPPDAAPPDEVPPPEELPDCARTEPAARLAEIKTADMVM